MRMNWKLNVVAAFCLFLCATSLCFANSRPGKRVSFNQGWRFQLGDITNGQYAGLNDSQWRQLDLPHDWSIRMKSEFPSAQEYSAQTARFPALTVVDIRAEQAAVTESYRNEVLVDVKTTLGEGPLWDVDEQRLYWIDSFDGRVFRCAADGHELRSWDVPRSSLPAAAPGRLTTPSRSVRP